MEHLVVKRVLTGVAVVAAAGLGFLGSVGTAAGAEPCGETESLQAPCTQADGTVNLPGNGAGGPAAQGQEDGTVNLPGNGVGGYVPSSVPAGSGGLAAATSESAELIEIAAVGGGIALMAVGGVGWYRRRQEPA